MQLDEFFESAATFARYYASVPDLQHSSAPGFTALMVAAWGCLIVAAVVIPFWIRSARGQLVGFTVATLGALMIFITVSVDSSAAKVRQDTIKQRLEQIAAALDQAKATRSNNGLFRERYELIAEDRHLSIRVDMAGILTNFAAISLGGLGAGLLTCAITSIRTRDEEENIEKQALELVEPDLPRLFFWTVLSAFSGVFAARCQCIRDGDVRARPPAACHGLRRPVHRVPGRCSRLFHLRIVNQGFPQGFAYLAVSGGRLPLFQCAIPDLGVPGLVDTADCCTGTDQRRQTGNRLKGQTQGPASPLSLTLSLTPDAQPAVAHRSSPWPAR